MLSISYTSIISNTKRKRKPNAEIYVTDTEKVQIRDLFTSLRGKKLFLNLVAPAFKFFLFS